MTRILCGLIGLETISLYGLFAVDANMLSGFTLFVLIISAFAIAGMLVVETLCQD